MGNLRTALEGHDETLQWADFQGSVPASLPPGEAAYTEARFDLAYDFDYDEEQKTRGYKLNNVHVKVVVERSRMWVVANGKTKDLLKHEQGHYDLVALLARDLYDELTGWNTAKPPKRFRKTTDLTTAVDGRARAARRLIGQLDGTPRAVGIYDKKTNHGLDAKAQVGWDKALADARTNGTRMTAALAALNGGSP
jgi:hypothetical protein